MISSHYKLSYTSGALLLSESIALAELRLECGDWELTSSKALQDNVLNARTNRSMKVLVREVRNRLEQLSNQELLYLINADRNGQSYLLWVAICRAYCLIRDYAIEVVHERYITFKRDLPKSGYDDFWTQKASLQPELNKVSASTFIKLRQVLYLMMRQIGIADKKDNIVACVLPLELVAFIKHRDEGELLLFPVFEGDYA